MTTRASINKDINGSYVLGRYAQPTYCHPELVSGSEKQMLKHVQHDRNKRVAFTLTEILLACVIVGVISALVLPAFVSKYQETTFERGFEREIKSLNNALDTLAITENKDYDKVGLLIKTCA